MSIDTNNRNSLSPMEGIAYALPVIPILVLMSTNNVLSGIYATHHGLSLSVISGVMLVAGLFDAVTDPSIGYLSDRWHARTGSRRLFVVGGAVMLIPCAWFLLNPGTEVTAYYFLCWYLLFYLAFTLFQIPHLTWGGELSPVSQEKTKAYGYRNYGVYLGMILFTLVPLSPISDSSKVTPETMRYLVFFAAVLLLPTLYMLLRHVPAGSHRLDQPHRPENPFRAMLALGGNTPLLLFLVVSVLFNMASAFYIGLQFMTMEAYLGLGDYYVHLLLFHLLVGTVAIKPGIWLINQVGKVRGWIIAILLSAAAFASLAFALLNSPYTFYALIVFNLVFGFSSAIVNVATYSLLSDISDYGTLKTGIDRSATCFALHSLTSKTCMAIGISLSIGLAGLLGFDPALAPGQQGNFVYWGLTLCMAIIPTVLSLLAAACVPRIAITSARHAIIRKRLDARIVRAQQQRSKQELSAASHVPFLAVSKQ